MGGMVSGGDEVSGRYFPSLGMGIESLGRLVFLGIWAREGYDWVLEGRGFCLVSEKDLVIWGWGLVVRLGLVRQM